MGLQTNYDAIEEKLFIIEAFLDNCTFPRVIVEAIEEKERDLINEQGSHSARISEIESEIADWMEELNDEKKEAEKAMCPCIKNV